MLAQFKEMYYLCSIRNKDNNHLTTTTIMITKGSAEYKKAQELASRIVKVANYQRVNDNTLYNIAFNPFYQFISSIKALNVFASKIAETIDSKCDVYGYKIANVSDKQSWILACAAIENNITLEY